MKRNNLFGKLSLLLVAAAAFQSCKKENGIDNNNILARPYVLYVANANGTIFSSNNGDSYKTVFSGDGLPVRSLAVSKNNILFVKDKSIFISENEGKNFNAVQATGISIPTTISWSNFLLSVEDQNRVYLSTFNGLGGVSVSLYDNGKSFGSDTNRILDTPTITESFVQVKSKILYSYSNGKSKLYTKLSADEPWRPRPATGLPTPFLFYLSNNDDVIIATDYAGNKGSWYSNDSGKTFVQYTGLPASTPLLSTATPVTGVTLIGTKGKGIYKYGNTTFAPSNSGIDPNTSVYGIVGKQNIYKNDITRDYIFIATNTGIYRSEDKAVTWIKVKTGDYRTIN